MESRKWQCTKLWYGYLAYRRQSEDVWPSGDRDSELSRPILHQSARHPVADLVSCGVWHKYSPHHGFTAGIVGERPPPSVKWLIFDTHHATCPGHGICHRPVCQSPAEYSKQRFLRKCHRV